MYMFKIIIYILVIIGAINWGLVGFFGFDLVAAIFGQMSVFARIIYAAIGLSALILLFTNRDIFKKNE